MPASGVIGSTNPGDTLSFTVPIPNPLSGVTWASATWVVLGWVEDVGSAFSFRLITNGTDSGSGTPGVGFAPSFGVVHSTAALTSAQLSDVNAHLNGTLTVQLAMDNANAAGSSLTVFGLALLLVPASGALATIRYLAPTSGVAPFDLAAPATLALAFSVANVGTTPRSGYADALWALASDNRGITVSAQETVKDDALNLVSLPNLTTNGAKASKTVLSAAQFTLTRSRSLASTLYRVTLNLTSSDPAVQRLPWLALILPSDTGGVPKVFFAQSDNGSLPNSGNDGGKTMASVLNPQNIVWGVGFLFATPGGGATLTDSVPFGQLQEFSLKDSLSLKELMGTSSLGPIAVGVAERKITGSSKYAAIRARQFQAARGATVTLSAAVASPATAPALTAAAGATTLTAGFVGVAYAYTNLAGETVVSPVQTVSVTAGQQINVTAIAPLPANVTGANWYVTSQSYTTAGQAAVAPLYLLTSNVGGAFSITAYGGSGGLTPQTLNQIIAPKTIVSAGLNDEPTLFSLHLRNPSDGSQAEMKLYNCIAPELDLGFKLRDFTIPNLNVNIYGDAVSGKFWDLILPGDQTLN